MARAPPRARLRQPYLGQFDAQQNKFVALPIDPGPSGDQVFLILYGTGIRNRRDLGAVKATPRLRAIDKDMQPRPFIEDFSPGYMQRVMDRMPKQGDKEPWMNTQSFKREQRTIGHGPIADGVMEFQTEATLKRAIAYSS